MSKNLTKASDWAQREINDLQAEYDTLNEQVKSIETRMRVIQGEIEMLHDIQERLGSKSVNDEVNI